MSRVVIIGAGVIGASIAYHLTLNGHSVTVIEQFLPGSGATSKSFSWINANVPETAEYFRLRKVAIDEYRNLPAPIAEAIGLRWGGSLWWDDDEASLAAQVREHEKLGYNIEVIDTKRFSELEPHVADPPSACIHATEEAALEPLLLTQTLLDQAALRGAEILIGCTVTGLVREDERFTGVDTSIGRKSADTVILAAGVWTESLLDAAGLRLPMDNRHGLIVHTNPVAPVLNHLVLPPEINFRQEKDGRIIVAEIFSGGSLHGNKLSADPLQLAGLIIEKLQKRLPGVDGLTAARAMVGYRPVPADGFPAIGVPRDGDGLYIAAMHSGITLGPAVGRLVAEEISGTDRSDLLAPYRPDRFN